MSNFVSVIFCQNCQSRFVEIAEYSSEGKGIIECRTCGNREEVKGFTLGRARLNNKELQQARDSRARRDEYEK